jgi:hypothetical protein
MDLLLHQISLGSASYHSRLGAPKEQACQSWLLIDLINQIKQFFEVPVALLLVQNAAMGILVTWHSSAVGMPTFPQNAEYQMPSHSENQLYG